MDFDHLRSLQELCLPVCLATITSSLSVTNVWSVRRQLMFPWYANNRSIKFVIDAFICDHFIEFLQTDQILSLDEQEMHWLFDNQDIKACEATMLHCLLRWYQHQQQDREKVFKDLFSKIHLNVIPVEYLRRVIKKYNLIRLMPELREYKQSEHGGLSNISELYKHNPHCNVALIGYTMEEYYVPYSDVKAADRYRYRLKCYLPFSSSHKLAEFSILQLPSLLEVERLSALESLHFVFREKLYVFHYYTIPSFVQNPMGYCMKLDNKGFSRIARSPQGVNLSGLSIACGMYIFFLGCCRFEDLPGNEVYRYDAVNDHWEQMASMIHRDYRPPDSVPISYHDRYIFVFDRRHCEKYDIFTNKWSAIQPMPDRMNCPSGLQVDDKIILFNFENASRTLSFIYEPRADAWEEFKNLHGFDQIFLHKFVRDLMSWCGKIFFLSRDKSYVHSISEMDLEERRIKPLFLSCFVWVYPHIRMALLSRGARVYMEHNQTVVYNTFLDIQ